MKKILSSTIMFFVFCAVGFTQNSIGGLVVDASTNEPLVGVSVREKGTTNGVFTALDGSFLLKVEPKSDIVFEYLGYVSLVLSEDQVLGEIKMLNDVVRLKDVIVTSQVAIQRKTPVAVSNISMDVIEHKLGNAEFPEILKSTPGVYATKGGGGYGDSKINMRGFTSENIAVMINGVPVNDMEWGGVYWSNWTGLSDVTSIMQTQRGLGASKVSSPSVGGSINIITRSLDSKKGGSASYSVGNDGYNKLLFNISSGMTSNGWAFTLLGSRTWGRGYIQGTQFEGWNYFANIAKMINDSHSLSLTVFGAPQTHYQRNRNDQLTIQEWQRVGKQYMNGDSYYKFNPTYGFAANGQRKMSSYNQYHKPQISLNWNWDINAKSNLSTVVYSSIGRGNGYSGQGASPYSNSSWYGASNGLINNAFRNENGTFAYNKIEEINMASSSGALLAMSQSKNNHNWYGFISTYSGSFTKNIDFYGGLDLRYYKGVHTNNIIDLYGGEYFIDGSRNGVKVANNSAAANPNFTKEKLQIGDVVYRDYDGFVTQAGAFTQIEGSFLNKSLTAFVAGSLSNTLYWRYDRFYYDAQKARSKTLRFIGYTIKGGVNKNLGRIHNVFANVGYISRAPYFSGGAFLQSTTSNEINKSAVNEKVFSVELGYGFRWRHITATLNAYHTMWLDKTMSRSTDFSYVNAEGQTISDRAIINMQGINATHQGVEAEIKATPAKWIELSIMLSLGNWRWSSDTTKAIGYFYNSQGQPLADNKGTIASAVGAADHARMRLQLKDVKVGGSAQTTYNFGVAFKPIKDLRVGFDINGFNNLYAEWSINSVDMVMNGKKEYKQSWKVPGAATVDLNASYKFKISGIDATISGTCQNLLNQQYITDATDGGDGKWQSARVFYGFGRTWTTRLKILF